MNPIEALAFSTTYNQFNGTTDNLSPRHNKPREQKPFIRGRVSVPSRG
jgi:hypothetical protein